MFTTEDPSAGTGLGIEDMLDMQLFSGFKLETRVVTSLWKIHTYSQSPISALEKANKEGRKGKGRR